MFEQRTRRILANNVSVFRAAPDLNLGAPFRHVAAATSERHDHLWLEETMSALQKACNLLLGATLIAGCSERIDPTASRSLPPASLAAVAPLTSVVTDPAGDAAWNLNSGPGSSKKVPDYLDLVRSEITQKGSDFTMTIDVAAPIGLPDVSTGNGLIGWAIGLDTDPTTAPAGYPLSNGTVVPFEFYVNVTYDGTRFQGMVIDRRPLLTGREAIVTPHPFSITDSRITMTVPASAVSAPSAFGWLSFAAVRTASHDGADAFNSVDVATAPSGGAATFPQ